VGHPTPTAGPSYANEYMYLLNQMTDSKKRERTKYTKI